MYLSDGSPSKYHLVILVNIKFRVPYSQRYLFNAIPDTNHNANPTNPNTRHRCEYGTNVSRYLLLTNCLR